MSGHTIEKHDAYLLIKLGGVLGFNECKIFDADVGNLITYSTQHVLVNCEKIEALPNDWIRSLLKLQMGLKKRNLQMRLINLSAQVLIFFKKEGIDTVFTISSDLKEALQALGVSAKKSFDTGFINPFLEATLHVLEIQANVKAVANKAILKKEDGQFLADISGIIGIVSEKFNGSVVISFPEATFLKVMSNMLGEEFTEINKDIVDGAGEITNMIFGQAKITLNEKGYGIKTALPSVVQGKNHSMSSQTRGPVVVIPFQSPAGQFHVEICLSE